MIQEFAIKHDIIPAKMRWKQAVSAVGSMYKKMFDLLGPDDRVKLSRMMEDWGLEHSEEVLKRLGAPRNLHGCAMALMAYHRIFGMKSSIVNETPAEVVVHVSHCMWKDKRGWTPQICASIEAFEAGVVKGIDSSIGHFYTMRRSLGDQVCEMHLSYHRETNAGLNPREKGSVP